MASAEVIAIHEAYEGSAGARLDVYVPRVAAQTGASLPTVVWFGGEEKALGRSLRTIAAAGFTTVRVNVSPAREPRHRNPMREALAALAYLKAHAERLHVDSGRFVLACEGAGAQFGVQLAAMIANRDDAKQIGIQPSLPREQLRALVLCSGAFDVHRHQRSGLLEALAEKFPPTFIAASHSDPLTPTIAAALRAHGVPVETVFFEQTFEESRSTLARLVVFLERYTATN